MRRFTLRLIIVLAVLLVVAQFAIPRVGEKAVEHRLTEHGGTADVHLSAFPAPLLLFGKGNELHIDASGLSVDLDPSQKDVFKHLDDFEDVKIAISDSRAGPFTISEFTVNRTAENQYDVAIAGSGTAGDVARYAGSRLGGSFAQALAGLAASALGGFSRPIPFDATMTIDTSNGEPVASGVQGAVDGLPAGPLAQVVANALLGATL